MELQVFPCTELVHQSAFTLQGNGRVFPPGFEGRLTSNKVTPGLARRMISELAITPSPMGRMASDSVARQEGSAQERRGSQHEEQHSSARLPVATLSVKPSPNKQRAAQQLYTPGARKRSGRAGILDLRTGRSSVFGIFHRLLL